MDENISLDESTIIDCVVKFLVNNPMAIGMLRRLRKDAGISTGRI